MANRHERDRMRRAPSTVSIASLRTRFAVDGAGTRARLSLADVVSLVNAQLDELETRQPSRRAVERVDGRTVRFYTSKGVIEPPEREGRNAWYSRRHVLALLAVKACQAKGLSLAQISALVRGGSDDSLLRLIEASATPTASVPSSLDVVEAFKIHVAPGCVLELPFRPSGPALVEVTLVLEQLGRALLRARPSSPGPPAPPSNPERNRS